MRRYREPAVAAFIFAIVASLMVHLPVYEVLGKLADHLRVNPPEVVRPPSTVEFNVDWDETPIADTQEEQKQVEPQPKAKPKKKPKEQQAQAKAEEVKPAEQVPDPEHQQAVQQKSQNSEVPPPDNAQYIAEENSRVEEETVAKLRNFIRDQDDPSAGVMAEPDLISPDEGNATEDDTADLRDKEGSNVRTATVEETLRERPKDAPDADPLQGDRVAKSSARRSAQPPNAEAPAPKAQQIITITDGSGTFTVSAPANRSGKGGRATQGTKGLNLNLTYSQFQAALGDSELRKSRNARIEERKSKRRGASRAKQWKEFRAAIENFTPAVKPGNQTALNAAASPFANYIASVHRRIHRQFAGKFLAGLPTLSTSPYADISLRTKLEVVLNRDGSVHRVGVVRTSGLLPFDFGAFNSVIRGQPYAEPPRSILSGDGRVYLHWAFYRNHRQCGTFNAEPYVLKNPPGTPRRRNSFIDGPDWGSTVPDDAEPTWGTEAEEDGDDAPKEERKKEKSAPPPPPTKQPERKEKHNVPTPPPGAAVG